MIMTKPTPPRRHINSIANRSAPYPIIPQRGELQPIHFLPVLDAHRVEIGPQGHADLQGKGFSLASQASPPWWIVETPPSA